jgi:hypothetical protein
LQRQFSSQNVESGGSIFENADFLTENDSMAESAGETTQ